MLGRWTKEVSLDSLISSEELAKLKDIRVKKMPQEMRQIGEGAFGKVFLYKFDDGSLRAGKKPRISLFSKSQGEQRQMRVVSKECTCHQNVQYIRTRFELTYYSDVYAPIFLEVGYYSMRFKLAGGAMKCRRILFKYHTVQYRHTLIPIKKNH